MLSPHSCELLARVAYPPRHWQYSLVYLLASSLQVDDRIDGHDAMRLAHLHIPDLISYTHSLRLQNAILEKHFRYKDWIRATSSSGEDDAHATRGMSRRGPIVSGWGETSKSRQADEDNIGQVTDAKGAQTSAFAATPSLTAAVEAYKGEAQSRNGMCTIGSRSYMQANKPPSDAPAMIYPSVSHKLQQFLPPDPVLLTFSTPPTYTVGRRHLLVNPISPEQQSFLTANGLATFHASPRGGLLTYHAPGQVTGYVIADLRRHGISARCWVKLLEESVMRTCLTWGVKTGRTDDPGVWVLDSATSARNSNDVKQRTAATNRKICAIGVQVSRGITSHGVGVNIYDRRISDKPAPGPLAAASASAVSQIDGAAGTYEFTPEQVSSASYDPATRGYLSWGFSRIIACGLEGKSVTWLNREFERPLDITTTGNSGFAGNELSSVQSIEASVSKVLANEVANAINTMKGKEKERVDGVYLISEKDVLD
jgi:lipoate-protein ligase B